MNDFPNLPKLWQVKTLGEVCDILDNMRKPINAIEREQRLKNSTHKYAYYGATGQVGYIDDFLCDFESILLGEIAHTTSGGTPSRKNLDYWNGNIKWLKSGELNDDYINEVEESITQIGLEKSSAKIFPKGTLLIALYGATIGKLGILNVETATNQAICAITPNNKLDTKYLFHFLFSIRDEMIQDAFGGAQSNISQTYLKQLKIPIPPLEIQKQIVAILERHFTSADKVSAYIDSCLSKAKQLKSSLLKSAFAGELV